MMHNNMYYPQSNAQESCYNYEYYNTLTTDPYSNYNSSYVDCTLSLGTPSTRSDNEKSKKQSSKKSGPSRVSSFCWDLLKQSTTTSSSSKLSKSGRVGVAGGVGGGGDQIGSRRCANCDTSSTPLWRNGPKGSKSLCNACGIRYKKEERKANAAASVNSSISGSAALESQYESSEQHYHYQYNSNSYNQHNLQAHKVNCLFPVATNEYRYMETDDTSHYEHGVNGAVSFLPWMMNVAERANLVVHDFTRR